MAGKIWTQMTEHAAGRRGKRIHLIGLLILTVLILASLACVSYYQLTCTMRGGKWRYDSRTKTEHCDHPSDLHDFDDQDSDITTSQEEGDTAKDNRSGEEGSNNKTKACLPDPDTYSLEFTNLVKQSGSNKSTCSAQGVITNLSNREMMFTAYRVNHSGGEDTFGEEWITDKYQILSPGERADYGFFFRCVGGSCDEGEWHYIQHISLLYNTEECERLVQSGEDKVPESIIQIDNPCD